MCLYINLKGKAKRCKSNKHFEAKVLKCKQKLVCGICVSVLSPIGSKYEGASGPNWRSAAKLSWIVEHVPWNHALQCIESLDLIDTIWWAFQVSKEWMVLTYKEHQRFLISPHKTFVES